MCGIAGFIGPGSIDSLSVSNCLDSMHHRGPDANGCKIFTHNNHKIALLHTRLAILDLDNRSAQPFRYQNSMIIFNGEIYNFIEIRAELEVHGFSFKTTGDTEVVAAAIDFWGDDAYSKFEGMWAMAHLDLESMNLTLSRDKFGEKPFYIYENEKGLYFSSEINSLRKLANKSFEVNFLFQIS